MKFNLSNRPQTLNKGAPRPSLAQIPWCNPEKSAEWFEGFEKELIGQITCGSPRATLKNKLIREILGDEK